MYDPNQPRIPEGHHGGGRWTRGGYGYLSEYGIEKIVRDLRVHQILEGTNEIMRLIVARKLIEGAR